MYTDTKYSENTTNLLQQNMNERKIFLNKYKNLSNGSGAAAVVCKLSTVVASRL